MIGMPGPSAVRRPARITLASTPPIVDRTMHSRGGSCGLGRGLRDRLPCGGEGIRREVAPEPDHDVDRIRREQGQRHGVLAEAQHRGHLATGARAGKLDPRVASPHGVDHGLVVDPPGAQQQARPWEPLRRDRRRNRRRPPPGRSRGRRRRCGRRPSGTWPEDTPPTALHVPGRRPAGVPLGRQAWIASRVIRRAWIRQITRVSRARCSTG